MSRVAKLLGFVTLSIAVCVGLQIYTSAQADSRRGAMLLPGAHVDAAARDLLDRACADCHSDHTRYPWYTFLPFVSAAIEEDVRRGREQLNLTRWNEYPRLRKQRALTGIANQVRDRAMPLESYVYMHPSAKLSDAEVETLFVWAQKERLRLIMEAAP